MRDWKQAEGTQSQKPLDVDTQSSPTTVYLRRNIEQVTKSQENSEDVQTWQYEEKELTTDEYNQMLIMQEVVSDKTEEILNFQKETVIDEYTQLLIEEGLL